MLNDPDVIEAFELKIEAYEPGVLAQLMDLSKKAHEREFNEQNELLKPKLNQHVAVEAQIKQLKQEYENLLTEQKREVDRQSYTDSFFEYFSEDLKTRQQSARDIIIQKINPLEVQLAELNHAIDIHTKAIDELDLEVKEAVRSRMSGPAIWKLSDQALLSSEGHIVFQCLAGERTVEFQPAFGGQNFLPFGTKQEDADANTSFFKITACLNGLDLPVRIAIEDLRSRQFLAYVTTATFANETTEEPALSSIKIDKVERAPEGYVATNLEERRIDTADPSHEKLIYQFLLKNQQRVTLEQELIRTAR